MRRALLLLAAGLLTLAVAVPTVSSAHGGGHHGKHHGKHKKHKKHKARFAGLPAPAATVASFEDGVLTIELADGATVSGAVTDDTFVGCVTTPAAPPASTIARRSTFGKRGWGRWGRHHEWGDGHRRCGRWSGCDASDLVTGTAVWKAKLDIGEDGAVWEKVKLIVEEDGDEQDS